MRQHGARFRPRLLSIVSPELSPPCRLISIVSPELSPPWRLISIVAPELFCLTQGLGNA